MTASGIAQGKGLAIFCTFRASSHSGKVTQIVKHAKESNSLIQKNWSPIEFEELADAIDKGDNAVISGYDDDKLQKYREIGRP